MKITVEKRPYILLEPAEKKAFGIVSDILYDIADNLDAEAPLEFKDFGWRFEGGGQLYYIAHILDGFADHFELKQAD